MLFGYVTKLPHLKFPADVGHEDVNLLLELLVELRNFEEALEVSDQVPVVPYDSIKQARIRLLVLDYKSLSSISFLFLYVMPSRMSRIDNEWSCNLIHSKTHFATAIFSQKVHHILCMKTRVCDGGMRFGD